MPIVFTFDIEGAHSNDRNRIQSLFERLGWENIGGSAYRYPKLGTNDEEHPVEDWMNHIIPALMLFRQYIIKSRNRLKKYTVDVQSSAGYKVETDYGAPPKNGNKKTNSGTEVKLYEPVNQSFGAKNLRAWIDNLDFPYEPMS